MLDSMTKVEMEEKRMMDDIRKKNVETKVMEKIMVGDIRNPFKLIGLFLIPGIFIAIGYGFLASPISDIKFPSIVILSLAGLFILVPIEIGIILYQSKKELGIFSVKRMMKYRSSVPVKKYLWLIPVILSWTILVMVLGNGVNEFIKDSLFSWLPDWYIISANYLVYEKWKLIVAFLCAFFIVGIILPIVEEIYFRGFLLPRMEWMGKFAPIFNAFLFSLYHLWTPWQTLTRTIALIPFCYVTYRIKNIKVAIIVHCLLNITGDAVVILVLAMQ